MYLLKGVVSLSTAMITSPGGSLSQNNCSWNTSTDAEAAFSGFPESPYPAEPNVIGGSSKEILAPLAPPLEDLPPPPDWAVAPAPPPPAAPPPSLG